uniref:AlNc14C531G12067 protein n=1 Tax=Albugo laibachii Nc14 TaxID=890382 RepID=F0X0X6_9STRA|nr:AlNc14C531G12067 [Albugo laibachii Nc14]|eukprot:CCA27422.1 AlNc14C531G12067 [Albugo laibachii Nc14]
MHRTTTCPPVEATEISIVKVKKLALVPSVAAATQRVRPTEHNKGNNGTQGVVPKRTVTMMKLPKPLHSANISRKALNASSDSGSTWTISGVCESPCKPPLSALVNESQL